MTPNEIIVDALQSKENKLRSKANKADVTGRPQGHVDFLINAADDIRKVRENILAGNITIVIH